MLGAADFAVNDKRSTTMDMSINLERIYLLHMSKKAQSPPKSFEDALRELEQILSDIEAGEVGLEESLVKYERGNFLIQHCRGVLGRAEKQIELLSKAPDDSIKSEMESLDAGADDDDEET
jgi:exodeoxyribonuclease VII small subunit